MSQSLLIHTFCGPGISSRDCEDPLSGAIHQATGPTGVVWGRMPQDGESTGRRRSTRGRPAQGRHKAQLSEDVETPEERLAERLQARGWSRAYSWTFCFSARWAEYHRPHVVDAFTT